MLNDQHRNIKLNRSDKTCELRRGGLAVKRRTPERDVGGSILTQVAVLCL